MSEVDALGTFCRVMFCSFRGCYGSGLDSKPARFRSKGLERSPGKGPSSKAEGPLALLKQSLDLSWLVYGIETDRCWC